MNEPSPTLPEDSAKRRRLSPLTKWLRHHQRPTPMEDNPLARFNLHLTDATPSKKPAVGDGEPNEPRNYDDRHPFTHSDVEEPELVASPDLKSELQEPHIIKDPETGQLFSVLYLNEGFEGRPLVATMGWSVTTDSLSTQYDLEQTALQTERPMIAISSLGSGESDKLTPEQKHELEDKEGEGIATIAKPLLRALKASGLIEIDVEGLSMGARLAASMAKEAALNPDLGPSVRNIVLIDPPGTEEKRWFKITWDFLREKRNMDKYVASTHDPHTPEGIWQFAKAYAKLAKIDVRGNFGSLPKAMGKKTLLEDIIDVANSDADTHITLIIATASTLSSPKEVVEFYKSLTPEQNAKLRLKLLSGETHAVGSGWSKRMAWHIAEALNFNFGTKAKDSNQ